MTTEIKFSFKQCQDVVNSLPSWTLTAWDGKKGTVTFERGSAMLKRGVTGMWAVTVASLDPDRNILDYEGPDADTASEAIRGCCAQLKIHSVIYEKMAAELIEKPRDPDCVPFHGERP